MVTYSSSGTTTLALAKNKSFGSFNQSAGTIIDNGNTLTVTGTGASTWTKSGGVFTPTGTVKFTGAAPQIGACGFNNLEIAVGGGNTATLTGDITLLGNMTLTSGTLSAGTRTIDVDGNWAASGGSFSAGTGLVTFSGTTQSITGDNTFYGLSVTAPTARTVSFGAGSTTSISANGSLVFSGPSGDYLTLRSSDDATPWHLHVSTSGTTISVTSVSVSYSDASGYATINAYDGTSFDGDNNTNWLFTYTPPAAGDEKPFNFNSIFMDGLDLF